MTVMIITTTITKNNHGTTANNNNNNNDINNGRNVKCILRLLQSQHPSTDMCKSTFSYYLLGLG